jgi:hypothetical protein
LLFYPSRRAAVFESWLACIDLGRGRIAYRLSVCHHVHHSAQNAPIILLLRPGPVDPQQRFNLRRHSSLNQNKSAHMVGFPIRLTNPLNLNMVS